VIRSPIGPHWLQAVLTESALERFSERRCTRRGGGWYGTGSEVLDESDSAGNITDEYVFFEGKRVTHRAVSADAVYFYAEDFLGSSRVIATTTGSVCFDADFYPYGGERDVTNTCAQNYKFEGKERDLETNNDDFGARYYSSQFGRWTSPDWSAVPAPVPYANLTNPQTLNLYAMVSDNPETFADLDGHCFVLALGVCSPAAPAAPAAKQQGTPGEKKDKTKFKKAIQDWAKAHPKTVITAAIAFQIALAIVTEGGSLAMEGAADAVELTEAAAAEGETAAAAETGAA
jgi:RHS repeat-associated protein